MQSLLNKDSKVLTKIVPFEEACCLMELFNCNLFIDGAVCFWFYYLGVSWEILSRTKITVQKLTVTAQNVGRFNRPVEPIEYLLTSSKCHQTKTKVGFIPSSFSLPNDNSTSSFSKISTKFFYYSGKPLIMGGDYHITNTGYFLKWGRNPRETVEEATVKKNMENPS